MASMIAILSVVCGTAVDRPASASTLYRGTFTPTDEATGKAGAFRDSYQTSGAASAVSTVADVAAEGDWPMAAANPQRTSWTTEEVRGQLRPIWYKPIEPYISQKVQIIAAYDTLYISTARGLYAIDAETGDERWVYPTELPLGHSPTVHNGKVYVGGFDHKIHAIDAFNGQGIWTFEAEKGFQTNPLVVDLDGNTYIYAGNRDGFMYALKDNSETAELYWTYKTGGPVLFSAAYKDGTVYFASNDSHAYALDARTGELIWKSQKLPGAGFHSWWPVVYQDLESGVDVVIFAGSQNYRTSLFLGPAGYIGAYDRNDVYPDRENEPRGTPVGPVGQEPGNWVEGTTTIDATRITEYFENKPWRRTYFVLDRLTGDEVKYDFDADGKEEHAPILWTGTHSGNRYPPVVGSDGILYQQNNYMSDLWICGGQVSGWMIDSPFISVPSPGRKAIDEPIAYSAGGNLVYWNHCCDRSAGAFDISIPNTRFFWDNPPYGVPPDPTREWVYYGYNLEDILPGYNIVYDGGGVYGGANGVYGNHGDQNPPIPYQGKVYMHRSNSVIAFGDYQGQPGSLPVWETVEVDEDIVNPLSTNELKQRLAVEVQKMLDAGHLRPGYTSTGIFDNSGHHACGDNLVDYWHNPSDTLYTLIRALPYLPEELQQSTRDYLQNEFVSYPPYDVIHIGWRDGAGREVFDLPPEVEADLVNHPPTIWSSGFIGWGGTPHSGARFPPHMFYALWRYAEVFGGARQIFDSSKDRLEPLPSDEILTEYSFVQNAYIAGYLGYLALEELAGYAESSDIRAELEGLLDFRATTFSKDTPYEGYHYCRELTVARNFMYLVPELGQYLDDHARAKVEAAINEYEDLAPYWFVSKAEESYREGVIKPFYDYSALFQAKALILEESREELAKYLDVPAVEVGDLFYIQNLVATIEAPHYLEKTATPISGNQGTAITYTLNFFGNGSTHTLTDTLPVGLSAPGNFELAGTSVTPTYDGGQHRLTWSDSPTTGQEVTIGYTVTITTSDHQALVNIAELSEAGDEPSTATATVIANPYLTYLPLILKGN